MPVRPDDPRLRLADLTCDEFMGADSTVHNDEEPDVLDEYRKQQRWRKMPQLSFLDPHDDFEMRGVTGPCDEPEIYLVHKPGPHEELVGYFCEATAFIEPGLRRCGLGREMILMAYTQAAWKDKRQLFTRPGKAAATDAHRYIVERARELGIRKSGLPPCICEIANIVAEIEAEVSATDKQFDKLYDSRPGGRPRPVPFFEPLPSARYLTISPNPSNDDVGSPTFSSDLIRHCLGYFQRPGVNPHEFFPDWEAGLAGIRPGRLLYSGNLAHVDLSPRATRSLTAINKSKEDIELFKVMIGQDIKYIFRMMAVVWPNLFGLFAAGTVTKSKPYIDKVLARHGPRFGFEFRLVRSFPAVPNVALGSSPAADEDARPKLYEVSHDREHKPLFFCPVGPSAKRPGQRDQFRRQFSDNANLLQKVLGL
jgi:hypothetical protein